MTTKDARQVIQIQLREINAPHRKASKVSVVPGPSRQSPRVASSTPRRSQPCTPLRRSPRTATGGPLVTSTPESRTQGHDDSFIPDLTNLSRVSRVSHVTNVSRRLLMSPNDKSADLFRL